MGEVRDEELLKLVDEEESRLRSGGFERKHSFVGTQVSLNIEVTRQRMLEVP